MADLEHIQLAHGGGGQLTSELIEQVILPSLGGSQNPRILSDAAIVNASGPLAFTTDSYVVQPLEFPGGDIGKLAVCGTVNDLAVSGAIPLALSFAIVAQEGLEIALLRRLLESAGRTASVAKVSIVTGDTKVVERTAGEGLIINTAGIGRVMDKARLGFDRIVSGDCLILTGPLGEHGLAVMSKRKGLSFSADLVSDCAPLHELTQALIEKLGPAVHFMRDPTRGGLAATVVDIANASHCDITLEEATIPVNKTALAASEMLGLDMLHIANEGKLVAVVEESAAKDALAILAKFAIARRSAIVGKIGSSSEMPLVEMATSFGGRRVVQMPYGEDLPRIC